MNCPLFVPWNNHKQKYPSSTILEVNVNNNNYSYNYNIYYTPIIFIFIQKNKLQKKKKIKKKVISIVQSKISTIPGNGAKNLMHTFVLIRLV